MIDAFRSTGHVMERKIVLMDQMRNPVHHSLANQECFNARTIRLASQGSGSVMESLIAMINLMKLSATLLVVNMPSSANQVDAVSLTPGSVMVMMIVPMGLMKTLLSATIENVMSKLSTSVTTENVSQSSGSVTLKMTVETTLMNQLIDVGTETVRQDGRNVLQGTTTVASLPGCSVMGKMIVEMDQMNPTLMTVQSAMKVETSNARMVDAFH